MTTSIKPTLIVIVGPTGSGKTDLSIEVARHFNAPILSADSRQIFKGMPIGTAQPSADQLAAVPHHFIASHNIETPYTCGDYERDALALLEQLFKEHAIVVAVGGSGLYIDALCHGMDALPAADPQLREKLMNRLDHFGLENLLEELKTLDPKYYEQVDRKNPKRVMRALEVCLLTGMPYSSQRSGTKTVRNFNILKIGTLVPREILYERIDRRVDQMLAEGLEAEAWKFYPYRHLNALQTVGYREFFDYFDHKYPREETIRLIKRNSRRYAKRQMTWFGRDDSIQWTEPTDLQSVIAIIEKFLSSNRIDV